ncbi:hypothetical protein GGR51DRAFT_50397 [Nemania sp. FL0031]|nr:hypothetical protein GGR51DRAFT_50397 [Nemania sp. FL0031]
MLAISSTTATRSQLLFLLLADQSINLILGIDKVEAEATTQLLGVTHFKKWREAGMAQPKHRIAQGGLQVNHRVLDSGVVICWGWANEKSDWRGQAGR